VVKTFPRRMMERHRGNQVGDHCEGEFRGGWEIKRKGFQGFTQEKNILDRKETKKGLQAM